MQVTQLIYSQDFNENCHEVLDRHKFLEMLIDVLTHQKDFDNSTLEFKWIKAGMQRSTTRSL